MEHGFHDGPDTNGATNGDAMNGYDGGRRKPGDGSAQLGSTVHDFLEWIRSRETDTPDDEFLSGEPEPVELVTAAPLRISRWQGVDERRLMSRGVLQPGERLELVGGDLLIRERQGDQHALAIELVGDAFRAALGAGWRVRVRLPVALDDESEPEPDVSIVQGTPREAAGRSTRSRPDLIVEVADSSLAFDRREKGSLYARAGVPDYWIVNLDDRVLEVYREPRPAVEAPFGWRYTTVRSLGPGAVVSPLAAPLAHVIVAYLLP
jgi:Uma2 family endonuclease